MSSLESGSQKVQEEEEEDDEATAAATVHSANLNGKLTDSRQQQQQQDDVNEGIGQRAASSGTRFGENLTTLMKFLSPIRNKFECLFSIW